MPTCEKCGQRIKLSRRAAGKMGAEARWKKKREAAGVEAPKILQQKASRLQPGVRITQPSLEAWLFGNERGRSRETVVAALVSPTGCLRCAAKHPPAYACGCGCHGPGAAG